MKKAKQKNKKLATITKKRSQERQTHTQFYYSFLTVVLVICSIQMSFSAILNISKIVAYRQKISTISKTAHEAENRNIELKKDLKNFSSVATLESIARNNLKMAGKNEILITVNSEEEIIPKKHHFLRNKKTGRRDETTNN